ncbi:MAG: hypothetical protein VYD90_10965 [Pseudomonadota bacterium]|nr:hypothetical protein [Pseudomonadota bacterium]
MESIPGLTVVSGKNFANERVDIDGVDFNECTFNNCILVYSGGLPFYFSGGGVTNTTIESEGHAKATLDALSAAYGAGMRSWVENIFALVRNPNLTKPN